MKKLLYFRIVVIISVSNQTEDNLVIDFMVSGVKVAGNWFNIQKWLNIVDEVKITNMI